MASLIDRMVRAAKLDIHLYEEVEADPQAMGQAMTVVVISSLAAGVGGSARDLMGLIVVSIAALLGWYVWAFLTYFIGTRLLSEPQTRADYGQLLRTLGFAASPGVLRIAGIVPILGGLVYLAGTIWMLVAMVIAIRQALDYRSTGRAFGVCLIGGIPYVVIMSILFRLLGMR